jgi:hypothetical protein
MTPDFENINERMERASLKELMPGFDKEAEWLQLAGKLHPAKKKMHLPMWSYAAAILLLLGVGIWFILPPTSKDQPTIVHQSVPTPVVPLADTSSKTQPAIAHADIPIKEVKPGRNENLIVTKKHMRLHKDHDLVTKYTAKDFICNGTPCPIQICINQTVTCPHTQPATITSSSTLEPDQSGQLRYKGHDKIAKNCSLTVNEIEITSIATGETILLNTNSTPSTAQDVFNYITGKKKGDVLAGMFSLDCDHQEQKHGVRLNNRHGDLIIE